MGSLEEGFANPYHRNVRNFEVLSLFSTYALIIATVLAIRH